VQLTKHRVQVLERKVQEPDNGKAASEEGSRADGRSAEVSQRVLEAEEGLDRDMSGDVIPIGTLRQTGTQPWNGLCGPSGICQWNDNLLSYSNSTPLQSGVMFRKWQGSYPALLLMR